MKIKRANMKRLASLSALGAGALCLTGTPAEASSIVFSGPVDLQVGQGGQRRGSITGPNGLRMLLRRTEHAVTSGRYSDGVRLFGLNGAEGTDLRFLAGRLDTTLARAFSAGQEWDSAKCAGERCGIARKAFVVALPIAI